jgi:16S rRNA processing protein RimM
MLSAYAAVATVMLSLTMPTPPDQSRQPRRDKRNKYAQFSKVEEVQQSLRFSSIADAGALGAGDGAAAAAATVTAERTRERDLWFYPDAAHIDQRDPTTFGFTEVGRVTGAHGIGGAVRVVSDSDFARERLCTPGVGWIRRPGRRAPREFTLLSGRPGPGTGVYLLKMEGVTSREQAAALRGSCLYVRREMTPDLEEGEILVWQLEGLQVACLRRPVHLTGEIQSILQLAGPVLGRVTGIVPKEELTGSPDLGNDLLEVTLLQKGEGDGGDPDTVLIPFVDAIVPAVSLEEGIVLIDPPDGLLELVQPKRRRRVVIRGLLPPVGYGRATGMLL